MEGDEGCISPNGKLLCLGQIEKSHATHDAIIPFMFDYWADLVVHLHLLKSSMPQGILNTIDWFKFGVALKT